MNRVHEAKRILGLAHLALRSDLHGRLRRARHVLGATGLECDPPGAPALRTEGLETDMLATHVDVPDLTSRHVDHPEPRITLARGPGDTENE